MVSSEPVTPEETASGCREPVRDEDVVFTLHRGSSCRGHGEEAGESLVPGCTVVICTYRRAANLAAFLESLRKQDLVPESLVIVDASPDEETQRIFVSDPLLDSIAGCVLYFRVAGRWKGLTRQRNFSLRGVQTDLMVFFDDDVELMPGCLREMVRVLRGSDGAVVGVGAVVQNEGPEPSLRRVWRLRRRLGIVGTLRPGRYTRSGMSTPWGAMPSDAPPIEGDWLPGCGMMWRTETVAELGFNDAFEGYSLGEDVDFSLRARRKGKLVMAPAARLRHLQPPAGRLDAYRLGYFTIYNRYQVHRRGLSERGWADVAAFVYAWSLDTVILLRHLAFPDRARSTFDHLRGRIRAVRDLLATRGRGEPARR
jgi:GT2 family glycosyltransferase